MINNITIGQIIAGASILAIIFGFIKGIGKFVDVYYIDKFKKMNLRIETIENSNTKQDEEIKDSKEERLILLKGQLACLKGLQEQGCNGPVTKGIQDIENYLVTKSHR